MRLNLNVPPLENMAAKALGAKWDPSYQTWYVDDVATLEPFRQWLDEGRRASQKQSAYMRALASGANRAQN